ncbi:hypothetical protein TrVFT333_005366 [Trichoderma virens FT-333]|nr:hypothetical protein TrVFT333_005366 [Trichoderma virens FT-333]
MACPRRSRLWWWVLRGSEKDTDGGTGRAAETGEATALQRARCQSQSEKAISHNATAVAMLQRRGVSGIDPAMAGQRRASDAMEMSGKSPTLEREIVTAQTGAYEV